MVRHPVAWVTAAGAAALALGFVFGAGLPEPSASAQPPTGAGAAAAEAPRARLVSGVTSPPERVDDFTPDKLAPGERPPQFIVVSFDGSCETPEGVMRRYLDTADAVDGHMTFNISGVCVLPNNEQRFAYQPPGRPAGTSDIGFAVPEWVRSRIVTWTEAYRKGHELGTHYMGHFCGPNGVQTWSTADWQSEMAQFDSFLANWPQHNPQVTDVDPLPFDASVIKGGRTPCLEGQRDQLYPALAAAGHTYESSNTGKLTWPRKVDGYDLWDFPLQGIKVAGTGARNLSMDYNFLVTLNAGATEAAPAQCAYIRQTVYESYMAAAEALYSGNRAPLFIGNHFNEWACGAFTESLDDFIRDFHARHPDVRFVSNNDLVEWLEAQDPAVLAELQARPPQQY